MPIPGWAATIAKHGYTSYDIARPLPQALDGRRAPLRQYNSKNGAEATHRDDGRTAQRSSDDRRVSRQLPPGYGHPDNLNYRGKYEDYNPRHKAQPHFRQQAPHGRPHYSRARSPRARSPRARSRSRARSPPRRSSLTKYRLPTEWRLADPPASLQRVADHLQELRSAEAHGKSLRNIAAQSQAIFRRWEDEDAPLLADFQRCYQLTTNGDKRDYKKNFVAAAKKWGTYTGGRYQKALVLRLVGEVGNGLLDPSAALSFAPTGTVAELGLYRTSASRLWSHLDTPDTDLQYLWYKVKEPKGVIKRAKDSQSIAGKGLRPSNEELDEIAAHLVEKVAERERAELQIIKIVSGLTSPDSSLWTTAVRPQGWPLAGCTDLERWAKAQPGSQSLS